MKTVLILDGQTIQTLSVCKTLKQKGYRVELFCDAKLSYGYHTRYADKTKIVISSKENPSKYKNALLEYLKSNLIDYIIPMNDDSAHLLSRYKTELLAFADFVIPDLEIFLNGYDKGRLMKICQDAKLPCPRTFVEISLANLETASKFVGFPALMKPNQTSGARGFVKVNNIEDLENHYEYVFKNYGNFHLQELIPEGGKQFKVGIFLHNRKLISSSVIEKIRYYPPKGGSSVFCKTIVRKDLVNLCLNLLIKIGWEGFADIDLIEDPRDNILKIMEINPRLPACNMVSLKSGVDFAENIIDLTAKNTLVKHSDQTEVYLRYFALDLLWILKTKFSVKKTRFWLQKFTNRNHYFQDLMLDDIFPFVFGTIGNIMKQLSPKFINSKKGMQ